MQQRAMEDMSKVEVVFWMEILEETYLRPQEKNTQIILFQGWNSESKEISTALVLCVVISRK